MSQDLEIAQLFKEIGRVKLVIQDMTAQGMKFGPEFLRYDITRALRAIEKNDKDLIKKLLHHFSKVY